MESLLVMAALFFVVGPIVMSFLLLGMRSRLATLERQVAEPPVCKIMDFGKFKYETQKREAEARKKQKIIEIKEIKFRPGTDTHDYDVKMRSVIKFLDEGDKVKVTLRFRGREMAHQDLGLELLNRVAAAVTEVGKIESMPKLEGRQMVMMIAPK